MEQGCIIRCEVRFDGSFKQVYSFSAETDSEFVDKLTNFRLDDRLLPSMCSCERDTHTAYTAARRMFRDMFALVETGPIGHDAANAFENVKYKFDFARCEVIVWKQSVVRRVREGWSRR